MVLALAVLSCEEQALSRKAVFVIVDGIPADVVERVSTPNLDAIAGDLGYSRAFVGGIPGTYRETPTISAPGYMSLLTGTWSHKHQVWGNYNLSPDYGYHNVFRIAKTADSTLRTAIFSTWTDNRTILVGEGAKGAGAVRIDFPFDGYELDTLRFPHDGASAYIRNIDQLVATEASRVIAEKAPDLSWVYLQYTDDMGHAFGDSDSFYNSVGFADSLLGLIWTGVQERVALGEDWLVVVTTDHGRDSLSGRDHGGQSERERQTWIATNARNLNRRFLEGTPAVTDILPVLLSHLGVTVPEELSREFDGIPFTGVYSFDAFEAYLDGEELVLSWDFQGGREEADVFVAFGATSRQYQHLAELDLGLESARIALSRTQLQELKDSGVLKLHAKAAHNGSNVWVFQP